MSAEKRAAVAEPQERHLTPAEEAAVIDLALCQQLEEDNGVIPDEWLEEQYGEAGLGLLATCEISESNRPNRRAGELIRNSFAGEAETVYGRARRKGVLWR